MIPRTDKLEDRDDFESPPHPYEEARQVSFRHRDTRSTKIWNRFVLFASLLIVTRSFNLAFVDLLQEKPAQKSVHGPQV